MGSKLIIAGGGIGGMAAALALDRAGIDVSVFERTASFAETGAGMSLWPNATRVLKSWGILEPLMATGEPFTQFDLLRPDGGAISRIAMDTVNSPCLCIHRAELHRLLLEALPAGRVVASRRLESFSEGPDGRVTAVFAGGTRVEADGLIGADGIGSAVRSQLHGAHAPVYRGYCIWRGIASGVGGRTRGTISETWGRGQRFGVLPMGRGRVCWYATRNAPAGQPDGPEGRKLEVARLFAGWHRPVQELIEATEPADILKNEARDRPALRRWGKGHVTLLGDAAHPITPNVGQGACMAIEDAACLAKALKQCGNLALSFSAYEDARRGRTAFVGRHSRRIGYLGQMENSLAVGVRDLVAKLVLTVSRDMALNQVYAYEV
jgi:2-polyprenyl-6-methoxyphenol hydroxylase-like FAD-dependent oxidoreductase